MISLIQRVISAKVSLHNSPDQSAQIHLGFLIHLGVAESDTVEDVDKLVSKISKIRLFSDENGKLNLDLKQAHASVLIISQFTLISDTTAGNRPSFIKAAKAQRAKELYQLFIDKLRLLAIPVGHGFFGEYMDIQATLDGPVTIILDSAKI